MTYNKITVAFGALRKITGPALQWQYNEKQILVINGLDLPDNYAVDFCNKGDTDTVTMTATAEGVEIPDQFLLTGRPLTAYIVVVDGESVNTIGEITFPVNVRGRRTDISPEPVEQQQIDALIGALNEGVERAEDAAELLENCSAEAETLSPGSPATAEYDDGVFRFGIPQGQRGETGPRGETGERGEKGDTGDTGPKGDKGDKLTYDDLTDADKADLVQGPILEAQTEAVQAVNTAGDTQTNRVNQAGTTQVAAVNQAGAAQIAAVEAEGTEQVGAVRAKGAEVLESIPDDYTALQHHVDAVTIYETASGAIASFEDGADALPIKKLVANIEPVQDLHGYDNPWPAGGGENLIDFEDVINATGTNSYYILYQIDHVIEADQQYTLSADIETSVVPFQFSLGVGDTTYRVDIINKQGQQNGRVYITFTINSAQIETYPNVFFRAPRYSAKTTFTYTLKNVMLIKGTSTSFQPYSNICPISGHTGAEIEQTGKNLLPLAFMTTTRNGVTFTRNTDGTITANGTATIDTYFRISNEVHPNKRMFLSGCPEGGSSTTYCLTYIGYVRDTGQGVMIETSYNDKAIAIYIANGYTVNNLVFKPMVQYYEGRTTEFEPYTGNQISVNWETEAGTVYGGTLDPVSGKLTVDRACVVIDGVNLTVRNNGQTNITTRALFMANSPAKAYGVDNFISDKFYYTMNPDIVGKAQGRPATTGVEFYLPYDVPDTAVGVNAWFADNPTQLCYLLATPITYQLTAEQISGILTTLYGQNNVWADTGDIAECEYPADTKLYIEQLTKPTEDDMTADHAISAGTFFMIGNSLYLATSQIAAGGTITPGTNATKLSLADALNQLNA